MTTADFSESSYAFALTRELVSGAYGTVIGPPEFPTLQAEGATGGGYDVKIPLQAVPLFLQFKVPQVMRRSSKYRPPQFPIPYYRFQLRTKRPNQHQLLRDLEAPNLQVFYASPIFHQSQELNRHYQTDAVVNHSVFIRPGDVGPMDDKDHHVAYSKTSTIAWCFSEPTRIRREISAEKMWTEIYSAVRDSPIRDAREFVASLGEQVETTINRGFSKMREEGYGLAAGYYDFREREFIEELPEEPFEQLRLRESSLAEIAVVTRSYLGCELFVVGAKDGQP